MTDYDKPVYTDNRKFREEDPCIKAHFDAVEKEAELFPKTNGIVSDKNLVIFSDCPICGSAEHDQLFVKYGFVHVQCRSCSHVFVRNRLREERLLDIYAKSEADELSSLRRKKHLPLNLYWNNIYEKYLNYLQSLGIANKNILDIGCGSGYFLSFCKENTDLNPHGLDFCENSREFLCGLLGKNYYFKKKVEEIEFDKNFGIISLWGVFEHVCDPVAILAKCKNILDGKGRIIILVPNLFSRAFKILGMNNPTLNPRAHINFYTRKSMEMLCGNVGLSVERVFQELPVIDLMHGHIDYSDELVQSILDRDEGYYHVYILKKTGDLKR